MNPKHPNRLTVRSLIVFLIIGCVASAFVSYKLAYAAAPTNVIDIRDRIPQDIWQAFDSEPEAALYGLWKAQQIIQTELDAQGSSMNATQVMATKVRAAIRYKKKFDARFNLVNNSGLAEDSATVQALDADIVTSEP